MTNIIGMALVVLSASITTNFCTNQVHITCEQAGCTNWVWGEVTVWDHYDYWNPNANSSHKEKMKYCNCWHSTNQVLPEVEITRLVIGTTNQPLFEIQKIRGLEGNGTYPLRRWNDGYYLVEPERKTK